jgi:putative ABC transport system permease protein
VQPSYFHTLGIPILRGRALSETDRSGSPPVIVVSDTFAKAYFPTSDPIGERVLIQELQPDKPQFGHEIAWEIVGVVGDERVNALAAGEAIGVYPPLAQAPVYGMYLVIRTGGDPTRLVAPLKAVVHDVNPDQPVTEVMTLEQVRDRFIAGDNLQTWLMTFFSALALVLATVGVYGVMSYSVAQRTREIAIRTALGADRRGILLLVMGRACALVTIGIVLGTAGALATATWMSSLLFGVKPRDPISLGAGTALLALVALLAAWVPARRASTVDPAHALRAD